MEFNTMILPNERLSVGELVSILNLKKCGRQFTGACPACGYPSGFSLMEKNSKPLFYCHAGGCTQARILQVLRGGEMRPLVSQQTATFSELASVLWRKSLPAVGTLVEAYLRGRGITVPIPSGIRYLPQAKHQTGRYFPVMIAGVSSTDGKSIRAVHRTFLQPDGHGKAPVETSKMSLGPIGGLAVHLTEPGETLLVAEGIETGLSVLQATGLPTWAALSAGGIQSLILPPLPLAQSVVICADADPVGINAAQVASERWLLEGREVKIAQPPMPGMDFNDLLKAEVSA